MAYEVTDGAILEFSLRGVYQEQTFISLFHYRLELASGSLDGRTTIDAANAKLNVSGPTSLTDVYASAIHQTAVLEEAVFQWIFPVRRARVVKTPAVLSGNVEGGLSPPNIAAAITKQSDTAGRKGVGTLHMPALSLDNINGGRLTLDGQDIYGPLQTRLKNVVNLEFGQNLVPVIFSRSNPAASPAITATFNHSEVRTMHRRTVGLGI